MTKKTLLSKEKAPPFLGKRWGLFLIFLLIFYLLIDYSSYTGLVSFTYLIFFIGLIIPLINLRWGLYYYIVVALLSDDISRIIGLPEFTSIHFTTLGHLTLISYLTIFMFCVALAHFFVHKKKFHIIFLDKIVAGLIFLFLIAAAIGLPNLLEFPREYIENASYIINLAIFYFVVRLVIIDEKSLKKLISIIIFAFVIKAVVGLFYYYFGFGQKAGASVRVFYESGGHLLGLPFLWLSLLLVFLWVKIPKSQKLLLAIFIFAILFHIITYASRANLIFLGLSIFLVFLFMLNWPPHIQKKSLIRYGIVVILVLVLVPIGIHLLRPGALDYVKWKLISTIEVDLEAEAPSSVAVRFLAGQNIWHHLDERGNLFWGEGLGGWFTDKHNPYFHRVLGAAAYPEEHIIARQVFSPHGLLFWIPLKMGIMGFIVFYLLLVIIFIYGYKIFKSAKDLNWKAIALGITVFLPLFFNKLYISKIQVFFGILLAILACIYILNRDKNREYQKLNNG